MAFPYATLCVQGIKDGTRRDALQAQFEAFGKVMDVTITPNKHMRGVPDSKIALVEFKKKEDARKAMQALNGRYVQGKCVMIRFARSAPGVRPPAPIPRQGSLELIPQTANLVSPLAAKFTPSTGDEVQNPPQPDEPSPGRQTRNPAGSLSHPKKLSSEQDNQAPIEEQSRKGPRMQTRTRAHRSDSPWGGRSTPLEDASKLANRTARRSPQQTRQRSRHLSRQRSRSRQQRSELKSRQRSRQRSRQPSQQRSRQRSSHNDDHCRRSPSARFRARGGTIRQDPRRERSPSRWRPT